MGEVDEFGADKQSEAGFQGIEQYYPSADTFSM